MESHIFNLSKSFKTNSLNTDIEGGINPGGLKREALLRPECLTPSVSLREVVVVWDKKYLLILTFLMYFCTSIKAPNLLRGLSGANLSPWSRTNFSLSVSVLLLRLKIPASLTLFDFFDRFLLPPLVPLLVLPPSCFSVGPWEKKGKWR